MNQIERRNGIITEIRGGATGFSFIELLVVLVILAIGSAFVVPRLAGTLDNISLGTASKKISASLRYARSRATTENRVYVVLFDFDKDCVTVRPVHAASNQDAGGDEAEDRQESAPSKTYSLPEKIRLEKGVSVDDEVDSGIFKIVFCPNGSSSGGKVLLKNDRGNRYQVQVDFITGSVRLGKAENLRSTNRELGLCSRTVFG